MTESTNSSQETAPGASGDHYLPALTGIRFFAIFHIFMFHLVSLYGSDRPEGMENLLVGFKTAPQTLVVFASNGWISTSFFFLLSGFILAYLYWGEDGQLVTTRRRFWQLRLHFGYTCGSRVTLFMKRK